MGSRQKRKGNTNQRGSEKAPLIPLPPTEWVIRFEESVERVDLRQVGHAAFDVARKAIEKKLKVNPKEYGDNLHHPLHGLFKLRSSHVRIAYHVQDIPPEVWILMIGDRKSIWEDEQAEILERLEAELGRHVIRQHGSRK